MSRRGRPGEPRRLRVIPTTADVPVQAAQAGPEAAPDSEAARYPRLPGEYDAVVEWIADFVTLTLGESSDIGADEREQLRPGMDALVEMAEADRDEVRDEWDSRSAFIAADPVVLAKEAGDTIERTRDAQQREREEFVADVAGRMRELLALASEARAVEDVLRAALTTSSVPAAPSPAQTT